MAQNVGHVLSMYMFWLRNKKVNFLARTLN